MARTQRGFLIEACTTNLWSKVFAMVLALAIWGSAYSGMSSDVVLVYSANLVVPEGYVLVSSLVEKGTEALKPFSGEIEVELTGQRSVLPKKGGSIQIKVSPLDDGLIDLSLISHYTLAGGIRVRSCNPVLLRCEVQKLKTATLPAAVGVSTTGEIGAGLIRHRTEVSPAIMMVRGPENILDDNLNLLRVETDAIDISGVTDEKLERKDVRVRLLGVANGSIELVTNRVDVVLHFESTVIREEIPSIPLRYGHIPKYFTVDGSYSEAKIQIEGPPSDIQQFREDVLAGKYVLFVNAEQDLEAQAEKIATLKDCHVVPALPASLKLTDVPGEIAYRVRKYTKTTSTPEGNGGQQ